MGRVFGRVRPARAEQRTAPDVIRGHIADAQDLSLGEIAGHEVLEAVADSDDFQTAVDGFDGHGCDDAVDAGCRPATDDDGQALAGRRIWHAG